MTVNKVKYGLSSVRVWPITETNGLVNYGAGISVPGAVSLSMSPVGSYEPFYADNTDYFGEESNDGYEGELEIALIPEAFEIEILGFTKDSNGAIVESAVKSGKKFAMAFQFEGDAKGTRHIIYRVSASRPNVESKTQEEGKKSPATDKFSFKASRDIATGNVKAKLEQGNPGYDTFFTSPYLENTVINTVASTAISFSKAAPVDKTIDATSTSVSNTVKDVKIDGASIGGANISYTGVDATIESAYLAGLANGTYTVVVEFAQGNSVAVTLTVAA